MSPRTPLLGSTKVAAVIGDPVGHSLSPTIHNAGFATCGLDWVYIALPVVAGRGADAVDAMRTLGIAGMSVTMPHKADVVTAADEIGEAAATLGAANCLTLLTGGRVRADNTDGRGFIDALFDDADIVAEGRSFAVIGAGGAARAVILALAEAGAREVSVINRSPDRGEVAARLAGPVGRVTEVEAVSGVDVVVNATPLGMGEDWHLPCAPSLLSAGQVAIDLVYEPSRTPWLAALAEAGVEIHNGTSMLVRQAAVAFRSWTGVDAPVKAMKMAVAEELSRR